MEPGELSATTTVINQAGSQGPKLGEVIATSKSKGGIYLFICFSIRRSLFQLIRGFFHFRVGGSLSNTLLCFLVFVFSLSF